MTDIKKMYIGLSVKYPLFLSDFNETWTLLTNFRKNPQISNFKKIRTVGAELFHADGRMDRRTDMLLTKSLRFNPKLIDVKSVAHKIAGVAVSFFYFPLFIIIQP